MRRLRRFFSRGSSSAVPGGTGHPSEGGCRRWTMEVILSVSGDARDGSREALADHLAVCPSCRAEEARARALREACLRVGTARGPAPADGFWEELAANLEVGSEPKATVPPVAWLPPRPWILRHRALAIAAIAAAVVGLAWPAATVLLQREAGEPSPQAALRERWTKDWDEFVSGSESGGGIPIDPFAPEIPNPEVIDF
jgi:hypothetical protein